MKLVRGKAVLVGRLETRGQSRVPVAAAVLGGLGPGERVRTIQVPIAGILGAVCTNGLLAAGDSRLSRFLPALHPPAVFSSFFSSSTVN